MYARAAVRFVNPPNGARAQVSSRRTPNVFGISCDLWHLLRDRLDHHGRITLCRRIRRLQAIREGVRFRRDSLSEQGSLEAERPPRFSAGGEEREGPRTLDSRPSQREGELR